MSDDLVIPLPPPRAPVPPPRVIRLAGVVPVPVYDGLVLHVPDTPAGHAAAKRAVRTLRLEADARRAA